MADNHIKTLDGGVDIMVDGQRWRLTPTEVKTMVNDVQLKTVLETRGGRTLPSGVYVHKNRNGKIAVARFKDGVMPQNFIWPEDDTMDQR